VENYTPLRKAMIQSNRKTRIIMVRHGQSIANKESRFAGHSDFDLSEIGHEQASLAAKYLSAIEKPDVIYSSDLSRAHNTAVPFAKEYGLPINDTEHLREMYAGKWEGEKVSDLIERFNEDMTAWRDDFSNARCTGGESVAELYARVVPAVKDIAKKHLGQTVLMTTHATPIRAIECYSRGWGADRMADVDFVRNSAINIFEYNDSDGSIIAIKTNIVDHLEDSLITEVPSSLKNTKPI